MNKRRFKFLFAYRNTTANLKNSFVVVLTLSLVFCMLILLFGMKSTFAQIYEHIARKDYPQIDIVLSYDEYSQARLLNKRDIVDEYQTDIDYSMAFFSLDVLTNYQEDIHYAKMMSSLTHEMEYLIDQDVYLSPNQMAITKTYASMYNIQVGDQVSFSILSDTFVYEVALILEDAGLFSGQTFFVDKQEMMEAIYGFSLDNFGNTLYLDVNDTSDIDGVIQMLKNDDAYEDYHIYPTVDQAYINNRAMDLTSMMLAMAIIVIFAILMVLDSLFPLVSRDIQQHQGVIAILGGEKSFVWHVYVIQWLIYATIAYLLGLGLSYIVINYGIRIYGIDAFIGPGWIPALLSFFLATVYIIIRAYIAYRRVYQKDVITMTYQRRYQVYHQRIFWVLIAFVLIIIVWLFKPFGLAYDALLIVIITIFLGFNLASYGVKLLSSLIQKQKRKTVFSIFQAKYLKNNKHIHQSLRVLLISFLSIMMIFAVRQFMFRELDQFQRFMDFDLALTNIQDYDESLLIELDEYEIQSAAKAAFYQDTDIIFSETDIEPCKFMVSMDLDAFQDNFAFDILDYRDDILAADQVGVLLPKSYRYVYQIDVGDEVVLDLNYKLQAVPAVIIGFLDTNIDNVAYTNIHYVEGYETLAVANTVFIKTNQSDLVFEELIRDYSHRMYFVLNPSVYFSDLIDDIENVTDYFSIFTSFMVFCFIIVIFNNTLLLFYSLKKDLGKIIILGANKAQIALTLFKEFGIILLHTSIIGMIMVSVLSLHLKYVVLLTGFYKDVTTTLLSNVYGLIFVTGILCLSYVYYFYHMTKIKLIEEIKIY